MSRESSGVRHVLKGHSNLRNVGCEIKSPRFKLVVLILGCMLRDYDLISLQFSLSIVVFSRALQVFLSVWPRLRITTVFSFVC